MESSCLVSSLIELPGGLSGPFPLPQVGKKFTSSQTGSKRGFDTRSQGSKWGRSNKGQQLEPSWPEETQSLLSLLLLPLPWSPLCSGITAWTTYSPRAWSYLVSGIHYFWEYWAVNLKGRGTDCWVLETRLWKLKDKILKSSDTIIHRLKALMITRGKTPSDPRD